MTHSDSHIGTIAPNTLNLSCKNNARDDRKSGVFTKSHVETSAPLTQSATNATRSYPDYGNLAEGTRLAELFSVHSSYIESIGARILGCEADTKDLVQDVFVHAHLGIAKLRNLRAVRPWLATIAKREAYSRLKRSKRRGETPLDTEEGRDSTLGGGPIAPSTTRLSEALSQMNESDANAFTLYYLRGLDLQETARREACSTATAKRRLRRARAAIRQALNGHEYSRNQESEARLCDAAL